MRRSQSSTLREGLSLVELLVAVVMMAILVVSAVMSWNGYIDEARKVSTLDRMTVIRKALEAWRADNPRTYPSYDIEPLVGRYLPGSEDDGWGSSFVVDPSFMRVISRGPNGILETPVPGHDESLASGSGGDDIVAHAQENGRLVVLSGGGPYDLYVVTPDGSRTSIVNGTVTGGDMAPGGGTLVYSSGTTFFRDLVTESNDIGDTEADFNQASSVVPMPWLTSTPAGGGYGMTCMAPDGVHAAVVRNLGAGKVGIYMGEIIDPSISQSAATQTITTLPAGHPLVNLENTRISWERSGSRLFLDGNNGSNDYVLQLSAAPGSKLTTPSFGKEAGIDIHSLDACATRDRLAMIRDGETRILTNTGAEVVTKAVTGATDKIVAFNRQGDGVVVVGADSSAWLWWPDQVDEVGRNPYRVVAPGDLGVIFDVRWR